MNQYEIYFQRYAKKKKKEKKATISNSNKFTEIDPQVISPVFRLLGCFLLDLIMDVPISRLIFPNVLSRNRESACNIWRATANRIYISTRHMIRVFPACHRLLADKSRLLLRNKKLHIDTHPRCVFSRENFSCCGSFNSE